MIAYADSEAQQFDQHTCYRPINSLLLPWPKTTQCLKLGVAQLHMATGPVVGSAHVCRLSVETELRPACTG